MDELSYLQSIRDLFFDGPALHHEEIRKYSAGYADGVDLGQALSQHRFGEYFDDCVLLCLFPSQTTSVIAHVSLLYLACFEVSGQYPVGTSDELEVMLDICANRAQHSHLSYFLLSIEQIDLTTNILGSLANHAPSIHHNKAQRAVEIFEGLKHRRQYFDVTDAL